MFNEREYKIGNLQLQLGSLKDELKDTNRAVEEKHAERDDLKQSLVLLKEVKEIEKQALEIVRKEHLKEESRHDNTITKLEREYQDKVLEGQKVIDSVLSVIKWLGLKSVSLKDGLNALSRDKDKLEKISLELKLLESSKRQYDELSSETNKTLNQAKQIQENILVARGELDSITEKIRKEKSSHRNWIKETKDKTNSYVISIKSLEKDWKRKNQDLRVVENRLKRKWKVLNPNSPFPKV